MPTPAELRALLDIEHGEARRRAQVLVATLRAGRYTAPSGREVSIDGLLRASVAGTVEYGPDTTPPVRPGRHETTIAVENTTTLLAARALTDAGLRAGLLNFASAHEPGGGFLRGARAQEESLARATGLYATLEDRAMYGWHARRHDPLYDDFVTWSPDVPVLQDDGGAWLERPWTVGMLTSPAVMALQVSRERRALIEPTMARRTHKVLAVAAAHGVEGLVLGAWGCGAFGNDGAMVARLFDEALAGPFAGVFRRVVFAVTDWSPERRFIGPFAARFGGR